MYCVHSFKPDMCSAVDLRNCVASHELHFAFKHSAHGTRLHLLFCRKQNMSRQKSVILLTDTQMITMFYAVGSPALACLPW